MSKLGIVFLLFSVAFTAVAVATAGVVGFFIAFLIIGIAQSIVFGTICPKCKKRHAGKKIGGRTEKPEGFFAAEKRFDLFQCKYCQHQWEVEEDNSTS